MTELNEAPERIAAYVGGAPSPFSSRYARRHVPLWSASSLVRTIEAEIIPRLLMAHGPSVDAARPVARTGDEIGRFADLVLGPDHARANDTIQHLRDRDVPLERIYLDLVAPTAWHLRDLWLTDIWDFADVTLGLWRLQQLLRDFSSAFCADGAKPAGMRALLSPSPGERHDVGHLMFSLVLAGEFFRRDGWDSWIEPDPTDRGFTDAVRTQWFDVVEFFANNDKKLDDLATSIRSVRRESPNPGVGILVCGPAFIKHPELVVLVGGDALVSDLSRETAQARNVVNLIAARR